MSFSEHVSSQSCKLFMVPSEPTHAPGRAPQQFTFEAPDTSDYDGSWSPLGNEIVFERGDYRVIRKGIPGLASDTTEYLVTASGDADVNGDLTPAISPNGQWVAFSRRNSMGSGYSLWKVPIAGGNATRLTDTDATEYADFYPRWSSDGAWITYQRQLSSPIRHDIRRVTATGASDQLVYSAGTTLNAANPAFSPDDSILTCAIGTADESTVDTRTHTIDPLLTTKKPILNYQDYAIASTYPFLFPRLSPDGTRLGLITKQVWAARRNMDLPPRITDVGIQAVVDSAARVEMNAIRLSQTTVAIQYDDPEADAVTCKAHFLEDGMSFDDCTLTWTPSAAVGSKFYVLFQVTTASGGTDNILGVFTVTGGGLEPEAATTTLAGPPDGPNPTRGEFALMAPFQSDGEARLTVFDLTGRRVAVVNGRPGMQLIWEGQGSDGRRVNPGMYLYRLEVGRYRRDGKLVVLR